MKNIFFLSALMGVLINLQGMAQVDTEPANQKRTPIAAFPFQNFSYDARSTALAGAGIATTPDAYSGLSNPAKVLFSSKDSTSKPFGFTASYSPYAPKLIEGKKLLGFSAFKANRNSAFGFTTRYLGAGNDIDIYDAKGVFNKSIKTNEYSVGTFYAFRPNKAKANSLSVGLRYTYSYLSEGLVVQTATTKPARVISGDVSYFHDGKKLQAHPKKWLNYGLALNNIGGKVAYGGTNKNTYQPTLLKMGVAQHIVFGANNSSKPSVFMLTAEANKLLVPTPNTSSKSISGMGSIFQSWGTAPDGIGETIQEFYYSFGAELQLKQQLFLRTGYFTAHKAKDDVHYLALGLGGRIGNMSLDGSYLLPSKANDVLQDTFQLSIRIDTK